MEMETQESQIPPTPSPNEIDPSPHRKNTKSVIKIIAGIAISIIIVTVIILVIQNMLLRKSISVLESNQIDTVTSADAVPITPPSPVSNYTKDTSNEWQQYENSNARFSINYPGGWRLQELDNAVGFGPKEIGEDFIWGVQYFDSAGKNRQSIISDIGKQFSDRKTTEEFINVNGLPAVKVVTTTDQLKDWYSVVIILKSENKLYAIGNGALTDANLNSLLLERTGTMHKLKFEDFYNSFVSHEYVYNGILINNYLGIKLTYPKNWTIIDNYKDPMTDYVASIGTPPFKRFMHETEAFLNIKKLPGIDTFATLEQAAKGRADYLDSTHYEEISIGTIHGVMINHSDTTGHYQEFIFRSGNTYVGISFPQNTSHQATIMEILNTLEVIAGN